MPPLRFDRFVFHPASGELIEDGAAEVRLEPQPARVLTVLLRRRGEVVSREELQREVWPADTFVDFERGLNYCVGRIRGALGDQAGAPRFIETLPRRGYRFLVPVTEVVDDVSPPASSKNETERPPISRLLRRGGLVAAAVALLTLTGIALRARRAAPTIAVTLFDNETGRADLDAAAQRLTDAVVERLARQPAAWSVIGNAAILRTPRPLRNLQTLAAALDANLFVIGQIQPGEHGFVVLAHLIRARDQRHLWVGRFETVDPADPALPEQVAERVAAALATPGRELR